LIDAHKPGEYGGTGKTADWEAIAKWRESRRFDIPLVLAGGLTPENVARAIQFVRPDAVDTASGVESAPGRKDPTRVQAFIAEAKQAFAAIG
jgi:phosphoribosylanthranilate isomerase